MGGNRGLGKLALQQGDFNKALLAFRKEFFVAPSAEANAHTLIALRRLQHQARHGTENPTLPELVNARSQDLIQEGMVPLRDPQLPPWFISLACDKCGTHLIADVLQALTGQTSNWQYHEAHYVMDRYPEPVEEGFFIAGNWYPSQQLVSMITENHGQVVMQIRDPRDMVVSGYFYCHKPHVLVNDSSFARHIRSMEKEEALAYLISNWFPALLMWIVVWMEQDLPLHITTFEQMVNDKRSAVQGIGDFLSIPTDEKLLGQVVEATDFKRKSPSLTIEGISEDFKRKGQSGDWRNHFSPALTEYCKAHAGGVLTALGYENDMNWSI